MNRPTFTDFIKSCQQILIEHPELADRVLVNTVRIHWTQKKIKFQVEDIK